MSEGANFHRNLSNASCDTPNPSWETVEECPRHPETWTNDEISLHSGDEDSWLIVTHQPDVGFTVMGCGVDDRDYFDLADHSLGEAPTSFSYHGETSSLPRFLFVGEEMMLRAMRFFYETGRRDGSLSWWNERELSELLR